MGHFANAHMKKSLWGHFSLVMVILTLFGGHVLSFSTPHHIIGGVRSHHTASVLVKSSHASSSSSSRSGLYSAPTPTSTLPEGATDLTGYKLWVTFTGFNVENMNCAIELKPNFQTDFNRGILSESPGFWRVVGYDDGKQEMVEAIQNVGAEYMFFFDLDEPTLLWRGIIDMENKKILDGVVVANKKRFGLFPYTETMAQFTANLLEPNEALPDVKLPKWDDQKFVPPADFLDPNDMKRYPEIFDPDFVKWWFDNEDSLAKGRGPIERPKAFWVPDSNARMAKDGEVKSKIDGLAGDQGGKPSNLRPRRKGKRK